MRSEIYQAIVTWLGLAGLWVMWHFLWKPQRVDIFRQRLFALRAELFDLAADGEVAFNTPAYTRLRFLLNGMIQYAHRISLPLLLLSVFLFKDAPETDRPDWEEALPNVPEDVRRKLLSVHERMADVFARHLIYGSITLGCLFCALTLLKFARFGMLLFIGRRRARDISEASSKNRLASVAASVRQAVTRSTRTDVAVIEARMLQEERFRRNLNPLAQMR
jgi:hypothetical protein